MTEESERWLTVVEAPEYEVSDRGGVRSLPRTILYKDGRVFKYGLRILKPSLNHAGYPRVTLIGRRHRLVHCLILEAFVGARPDAQVCRHLNGDPTDNRLSNLRWGTESENMQDMIAHGRHHLVNRTHCLYGHSLSEPNVTPGARRLGQRACLACSRARATCRKARVNHGVALDFLTVANAKYELIVNPPKPARRAAPRFCELSTCSNQLVRAKDERPGMFSRRRFCGQYCARRMDRGSDIPATAKLTPEAVRIIRDTPPTVGSQTKLAKRFGVTTVTISKVVRGESWRRVA